jgi:hypothetical protein
MFNPTAFQLIKNFDDLPDSALLPTKATALILGVSERTVRREVLSTQLTRVQISAGRYGFRVGDIRALINHARAPP